MRVRTLTQELVVAGFVGLGMLGVGVLLGTVIDMATVGRSVWAAIAWGVPVVLVAGLIAGLVMMCLSYAMAASVRDGLERKGRGVGGVVDLGGQGR
jgi:hypothetical protein